MTPPNRSQGQLVMPRLDKGGPEKDTSEQKNFSAKQRVLGLIFGVLFGFLLQKGGVAKYDVLLGALLLEDFTAIQVMLTAIIVGSIGIFSLHGLGLVKLHIKPTRYAANISGGLLFGVGFGLIGYCPGTSAAALGQGSWDAAAAIAGLLAGSYLFAELSGWLDRTIMKWGDRGKVMLPELIGVRLRIFLFIWIPILLIALLALDRYARGQ